MENSFPLTFELSDGKVKMVTFVCPICNGKEAWIDGPKGPEDFTRFKIGNLRCKDCLWHSGMGKLQFAVARALHKEWVLRNEGEVSESFDVT